jgi:hypothetical protein
MKKTIHQMKSQLLWLDLRALYIYSFSSSLDGSAIFQNCVMREKKTKVSKKEFLLFFNPRLDIIHLDYL